MWNFKPERMVCDVVIFKGDLLSPWNTIIYCACDLVSGCSQSQAVPAIPSASRSFGCRGRVCGQWLSSATLPSQRNLSHHIPHLRWLLMLLFFFVLLFKSLSYMFASAVMKLFAANSFSNILLVECWYICVCVSSIFFFFFLMTGNGLVISVL